VAAPGMEQFAQNAAGGQGEPPQHAQPQPKQRVSWPGLPGLVAALPEPQWRTGVKP
jgi:hypothetical protein